MSVSALAPYQRAPVVEPEPIVPPLPPLPLLLQPVDPAPRPLPLAVADPVPVASTPTPLPLAVADPPPNVSLGARPGSPTDPNYHPALTSLVPGLVSMGGNSAPTFAQSVAGQAAKPVDQELMALSAAAYAPPTAENVPVEGTNWTRVGTDELLSDPRNGNLTPEMFGDGNDSWDALVDADPATSPSSGFKAALFVNPQGDHVVAFAGSELGLTSGELRDWTTDAAQGAGLQTEQYDRAVTLAQEASRAFDGDVVMTGHSLGGGLASLASAVTGTPAVTFNAAGVHDDTYEQHGLNPNIARAEAGSGQIRTYQIEGELLTGLQENVPGLSAIAPDAAGTVIPLHDPDPPAESPAPTLELGSGAGPFGNLDPFWNTITAADYVVDSTVHDFNSLATDVSSSFRLHGQDSLIDALAQQHPWTS